MRQETRRGKEIRCPTCGKLLAVAVDGKVHVRYKKEVNFAVRGELWVVCRGCGKVQRIKIEKEKFTVG